MPPPDLLIPFFLASALFACVPGSSMIYAATRTIAGGRRAGWWSALGFHLAGTCHVAAAAFGVSALLTAVPALFVAMKLAGAAYLVWLGIGMLRAPASGDPADASASTGTRPSGTTALRHSFLVEALNPKSAVFFLAFLPQFADPAAALPVWAQIAGLGAIVNALFSLTDAVMIEGAHALSARLRASGRLLRTFQRVGGGCLIVLGVKLALARSS